MTDRDVVRAAQERLHGEGYDYTPGSPHLRHAALRDRVTNNIRDAIAEILARQESCDVLEVGAGHGAFTDTVLEAGGRPTATEMSRPSLDLLKKKYQHNPVVRLLFDEDGNTWQRDGSSYDVILFISVIHHIPDYMATVIGMCDSILRPGGTIVTFQDPLWYPRQTRWAGVANWGSYFVWRATQMRDIRRGINTRIRRLKGEFNEDDLVEYHVVRDGVDDVLLEDALKRRFADVQVDRYFSTFMPLLQRVGTKYFPANTFGLVARGRQSY